MIMKKVVREQKIRGSKARCLELTSMAPDYVAAIMKEVASPFAEIDPEHDIWMPKGFFDSKEAKLDKCALFLPADIRRTLTEWWLEFPRGANTPNWDIVSTCMMGKRKLKARARVQVCIQRRITSGSVPQ